MNILLCCSAGMSTSLLVTKMEAAAKARGLEGKIWAVSGDAVKTNIDQADVLLLGPQVRYMLSSMKTLAPSCGMTCWITGVSSGKLSERGVPAAMSRINRSCILRPASRNSSRSRKRARSSISEKSSENSSAEVRCE